MVDLKGTLCFKVASMAGSIAFIALVIAGIATAIIYLAYVSPYMTTYALTAVYYLALGAAALAVTALVYTAFRACFGCMNDQVEEILDAQRG
jgi:hypothetical protein